MKSNTSITGVKLRSSLIVPYVKMRSIRAPDETLPLDSWRKAMTGAKSWLSSVVL